MFKALLTSVFITLCSMNPLYAEEIFQEMPQNFHPEIEVSGCFIKNGEEILFLKRLQDKPQGGTWAIPGGKSDEGETAEEAVIREIHEETGIEMQQQSLTCFGKFYMSHSTGDFVFHVFEYRLTEDFKVKFNPEEHADYRWVTLEDALEMSLIPGEAKLIELAYGVQPSTNFNSYHFSNTG